MTTPFAPGTPAMYRVQSAPAATPTELHAVPTPAAGAAKAASPLSPENPLFWFGVLAAVTFGAAAFSTSVRVGKTTSTLSLGKT